MVPRKWGGEELLVLISIMLKTFIGQVTRGLSLLYSPPPDLAYCGQSNALIKKGSFYFSIPLSSEHAMSSGLQKIGSMDMAHLSKKRPMTGLESFEYMYI